MRASDFRNRGSSKRRHNHTPSRISANLSTCAPSPTDSIVGLGGTVRPAALRPCDADNPAGASLDRVRSLRQARGAGLSGGAVDNPATGPGAEGGQQVPAGSADDVRFLRREAEHSGDRRSGPRPSAAARPARRHRVRPRIQAARDDHSDSGAGLADRAYSSGSGGAEPQPGVRARTPTSEMRLGIYLFRLIHVYA